MRGLSATCCLVTPLSLSKDTFPLKNNSRQSSFLNYHPQNLYHTSAILAAAIDTMTLPWRSYRNRKGMGEIVNKLNLYGRKIAVAAMALPFPLRGNDFLVDFLETLENTPGMNFHEEINLMSLTPGCHNVTNHVQMEALSLRGINAKERFKPKRDMRSNKLPEYTGRFASIDSIPCALFSHFTKMKEIGRGVLPVPSSITAINTSLPTGCPFPHIFDRAKVSSDGFLNDEDFSGNSGFHSIKYYVINLRGFTLGEEHFWGKFKK